MIRPADPKRAEQAISEFLDALGYDPTCPELRETPSRVVEAYLRDLIAGEQVDLDELIVQGSVPATSKSLVVIADIAVATLCPHHLLPAEGRATVAYVPGRCLLGLGTVPALVNALSRRLTLQESITHGVVEALIDKAGAEGAYCQLALDHCCLRLRGQRQASAKVLSSYRAGSLLEPERSRELELLLYAK